MIRLKNLERSYKTAAGETWVLRRIDLTIPEGEFLTVMGPSGAGKSSLLNALALLDDQWAGEYWFRDQAVHGMKRKDRSELAKRNIGMVFQSYHLLDDLTVQENIDLPLSYKDIPRSERQAMVADTLDRFQIVAKKDLYPNQLSGGQQQLVGIARAVIHKPALLLADEPTGNLHSSQAKEIMELFTELNRQGTTIVQVTHSDVNASYGSADDSTARWLDGQRHRQSHAGSGGSGGPVMIERCSRSPLLVTLLCSLLVSAQGQTASSASCRRHRRNPHRKRRWRSRLRRSWPCRIRWEPFGAYRSSTVPEPQLTNSPRLDQLIRDGKLYISLNDAISLAIENNLDVAIARYNLPIADTDILRTKAGGSFRGVNTGVVQGTPGGGVGGFGTGAPGAGAGGTTGGAGGAGAGAAGLVQSTLGIGAPVQSYDPAITGNMGIEHLTHAALQHSDLRRSLVAAEHWRRSTWPTSRRFRPEPASPSNRTTTARRRTAFSAVWFPSLGSYYRVTVQQQLLAGFGFGPNLRFLRIARNNKKISDIAFKDQLVATITQIANIYWDLVSAYEQERVTEQSYCFRAAEPRQCAEAVAA